MMKYVVCGTNVEDVENGVQAMKLAMASGATCGVGGSTMAEVEQGLEAMKQIVGGYSTPTPKACSRSCSVSGREALNMIEDVESKISYPNYEEGYIALSYPNGEVISKLHSTSEKAMMEVLKDGWKMDEICVEYVEAYDDGSYNSISTAYFPN